MARLGVAYSVGIDYGTVDYRSIHQRPTVLTRLGIDDPSIARSVQIIPSDIHHIPFDDNYFDLIYSTSVLEHVHDLENGFAEMARVLKPGGIMIHGVDPYFSPRGGHASCTLDFPWGHARLSSSEFRRYIKEFRPYEYDHAMNMYEYLFNRPRISFHEIEQFIGQAGLSILSWQEHWRTNHLPSSKIWREVNHLYPSVSMRDLAVDALRLVLIKQ